ncbi:hypothetical protein [Symbioplanes lichenis]|uniref:hypothetical protein n=1 Tax=Symbioplanes lichenis TaxID=1629072 RepID=UPI002739472A|nr:hypothetical protein [Actinoplanes lichenis]
MDPDPVGVVVGAMCQGAVAALSRGSEDSVMTAYARLRDKVLRRGREAALDVETPHEELLEVITALRGIVERMQLSHDDVLVQEAESARENFVINIYGGQGTVNHPQAAIHQTFNNSTERVS